VVSAYALTFAASMLAFGMVGDVSFCELLKLENGGTAPSVCSSVG